MTDNYLQDTKARLVAMQNDIHTALGKTPSAREYGLFTRSAYPTWGSRTENTVITPKEYGSQRRVHTIIMTWTLGPKTGAEGRLETLADEWIVTVLDFFQEHPDLTSSTFTRFPNWMDEDGAYISQASGVQYGNAAQDGNQTAFIQFILQAPFRVGA